MGSLGDDTALRNITFRNIVFENTEAAAKIKTHAGARNSSVHDVRWENLVLHNVQQAVCFDMFYNHGTNETTDFNISGVTIRNVTAYGTKTEIGKAVSPGIFHCQETFPCADIRLFDVHQVDSQEAFDCYNAFGIFQDVSPLPCLRSSSEGVLV